MSPDFAHGASVYLTCLWLGRGPQLTACGGRERVPLSSKTLCRNKICTCCTMEHTRMGDFACSIFIVTPHSWQTFLNYMQVNWSNLTQTIEEVFHNLNNHEGIPKLDVDHRRDDHASPMSLYRFMLKPTWTIFSALWHKSKFNLNFKKIKFLGFHIVVGTRKDLSIDVSITNVGLTLTKLRWFQLFGTIRNTSQNSISDFFF